MICRLLALDVDGTLVGPDNHVTPELAAALADAEQTGVAVCLATGRSHMETVAVWRQLPLTAPHQPMVTVGGALVVDPADARTLWQRPLDRELAWEFADAVSELGYTVMALVDPWQHGVDYYLSEGEDIDFVERNLLSRMDFRVRRLPDLRDAGEAMPRPVRISALVQPGDAEMLSARLTERFGQRMHLHPILAPNYGVTIVEAFAPDANKWTGLGYVAKQLDIGPEQVVAVGDDINDAPMLRGAGLGVAMPDATDAARGAADIVADAGLAAFIQGLLDGRFDGVRTGQG